MSLEDLRTANSSSIPPLGRKSSSIHSAANDRSSEDIEIAFEVDALPTYKTIQNQLDLMSKLHGLICA